MIVLSTFVILLLLLLLLLNVSYKHTHSLPKSNHYLVRIPISSLSDTSIDIENMVSDIMSHGEKWILASVTPEQYKNLQAKNIQVIILHKDLDVYVNQLQAMSMEQTMRADDFFSQYNSYQDIVNYLKTLPNYTEMNGKSLEGRAIPVISFGSTSAPMAIYIQGNIHAREWITNASLLVAIDKFSKSFTKNVQLYIAPMVNPDGYEYSRITTRLWRGNRNTKICNRGVDLNRNFNGYNSWKTSTCSETYGGDKALSEPESKIMLDFVNSISKKQKVIGAIDFHSYSQLILWPLGYKDSKPLPTDTILKKASETIRDAVQKSHSVTYKAENSKSLYSVNGGFADQLYDTLTKNSNTNPKSLVVLTIELPPNGDSKDIGFVLPPSQIKPIGEQVYTIINTMIDHCLTL